METSICSPISSVFQTRNPYLTLLHTNPTFNIVCRNRNPNLLGKINKSKHLIGNCRFPTKILAVNEVASAGGDPAQAEITWQIAVGALAGVTPFVVAGIEFSKRIVAQRKCGVCGGSGLVLREDYYFRCPGCGGFLPWQSWKRFFSG